MFAGAALNSAEEATRSVISTALSRLNAFLDSEMEQILCFDTALDAEKFCAEKSAIFIVLPEEDSTKYFMVSLMLQSLYREILTVADERGGKLPGRVMFFLDEIGTIPPIESLELMFSASRSRRLTLVPILQSITGQLVKNYGKEGAEIIVDNCQDVIFGGFAPGSQTAPEMSKSLGTYTAMSGSVSRGKNDPSQSLQMIERPLMTSDELKTLSKGEFVVMKTGARPMKTRLRLFTEWGIEFGEPFEMPERATRQVHYADKQELENAIMRKRFEENAADGGNGEFDNSLDDDYEDTAAHKRFANSFEEALALKHFADSTADSVAGGTADAKPQRKPLPKLRVK
jgi:type IV secretion system protein VirD4